MFVSDERDRTRLLVLADRQDYRAGETADVNLYWREKPALALVTFEGSRVFGYRLVPLQTGANKLPVPMGADLAPNFELAVAVMTEAARFHQASCPFTIERELRVSLDVRRPGGAAGPPAPGEPVEVTVTTSDPQGKPVAAEVSLALVERALLEEFPGTLPEIRAMFRGQPRTPAVRTGSSVSFAYRPPTRFAGTTVMAEAERPQETAQRVPWPAGMGGGGFFGGSTPAESQPSPAIRAAASFEQLVQWMEQAGKPSDEEVDEAAETDAEAAAGGAEETSGQPGGSVGRPATTSGPATTLRGPGHPAEPETGYWNPAVVTGDDGRATVVIPLPDRVAAWRLLAQGVTVDTLAGDASVEFVATKDLYGQWKLPSAFTDGDEADVVALVHNRLPAEQTVEVTLATQIGSRRAEERKTVKVAAASVAEVPFHVQLDLAEFDAGARPPSDAASEAVFQLNLTAGQRRDVLRRAVPIQPYGMPVSVASGGVADANTAAWVEPPATMPLLSPRLQIVVGATVERSLLDAVLGEPAPVCVSPVETAASNLMAALALQQLFGAAPVADGPVAQSLDTRIRAALGTLISAQHEKDGGWSWSARADTADRFVTARVLWALGLAGKAGYPVPHEVREKALAAWRTNGPPCPTTTTRARRYCCTPAALPASGTSSRRTGCTACGRHCRPRPCCTWRSPCWKWSDLRPPRNCWTWSPNGSWTTPNRQAPVGPSNDSPTELRSLYALALLAARPQEPKTQELIDWLLAHRTGQRWSPDKATGPAMLALCRWFGQRRSPAERYRLAVSVNNQPAKILELDASAPSQVFDVPAALLVPGKQQVRFELTGRGRYAYQVLLSGFVPADQLKSTTAACRVERFYSPAPLERDGQPVPRGFDFLKQNLLPFRNELHQLPVGRLGEVELRIVRDVAPWVPAEQIEYLVVREPLPAGTAVVESSIHGQFEWFEQEPGAITFYVGNRRKIGSLSYALQGYLPGTYRAAPTIVRNAHRPDQIAVAQPHTLTVLPLGAESTDPYRLTPQELLALGQRAFQRHQWQEANSLLTELLTEWELSGDVYRDTVTMLLDVQLELNNAGQTVKYFEIIRDKFPAERIPFAKLLRSRCCLSSDRRARAEFPGLPSHRRELVHVRDGRAGVPGGPRRVPAERGCDGALLREYPPEPYTAAARFGLAQQLAAKAPQAADDPKLKAAGIGRTELLVRAGRLLEAFLVDHPDDPAADQVAFTAASGLLELEPL